MRNLSDTDNKQSLLIPSLIALGGLSLLGFGIYKLVSKKRDQKEIDKANANALAHTLNLKKTNAKISAIENKAFVKGFNGYKKNVTINLTDQAKKIIDQFFRKFTDKNGLVTYSRKPPEFVKEEIIESALFSTPLNSMAKLYKLYNIYTGENLKSDTLLLGRNLQAKIEGLNRVAYKNYPETFKK